MSDKSDSTPPRKSSKGSKTTPNDKQTIATRQSRSSSNVSAVLPQLSYATNTNAEEMQPLLRKVQTVRLARLTWVMNCTLFISILIFVAALTILALGISTFTYTIIFPYHNYFVVEFNADDSYSIDPGVAVSSIGGKVRAGSGFSFIYQRVTNDALPSFPLQVQTFSFFPSNPKMVLTYNANGDKRLFSTLVDDETIVSNYSSFTTTTNPPRIFDTKPVTSSRFAVLYADDDITTYGTKLFIVQGDSKDEKSIQFQSPFQIAESSIQGQAYLAVLGNDRYSIIMHQESSIGTGCINYLLQYVPGNDTWSTLDSQFLFASCRTGNISPMGDTRAVIATETDIRIVDYSSDKIKVISPVSKFTCRPSYLVRSNVQTTTTTSSDITSQIDVKATSSHGFILSCTWFKSAAALYGVLRSPTNQIQLGDFIEFDSAAVPGTVQLSTALELSSHDKHSVYATYRSQASGNYQTIRCSMLETNQGLFVTFSKPYVHMTYSPSDKQIVTHSSSPSSSSCCCNHYYQTSTNEQNNGTKFVTSVDVTGVSRYGIMFVSSSKGDTNGIFELELAKWSGGIKWVGISVTDSSSENGKTKVVQKGITWGHQNLISGSSYYADVNGQLTLSKTDTYVGIARSSSEIMLDDDFVR